MTVDQDRQATARERKRLIMQTLDHNLSLRPGSPASRFNDEVGATRTIVTDSDIDGLVSACMVASVSDWRVGAIVMKSGQVLTAPTFSSITALLADQTAPPFGLDIFAADFPSVSNHPVFFGTTDRTRPVALRDALRAFDYAVADAVDLQGSICLSAWAGISATFGTDNPKGMPYKYPLGTAQVLLALLEVIGRPPRFYDRQYLPWLIANCDGGVDTIRTYPWNVENWWSGLAAVAGPASQSEALYRLVSNQRPTEFLDVDRRLRWDEPVRSKALNSKWNLASQSIETVQTAVDLITGLSGWPDPFMGGVGSLATWGASSPTRGVLSVKGLSKADPGVLKAHLGAAQGALHMNFSNFKERGVALGWMASEKLPIVEAAIGSTDAPVEETDEDAPSEETLFQT